MRDPMRGERLKTRAQATMSPPVSFQGSFAERKEKEACHFRLRRDGLWRTASASNGFRSPGGWLSVCSFLTLESEHQRMCKPHFGMGYHISNSLSGEDVFL